MKLVTAAVALAAMGALAAPAFAQSAGDITLGLGLGYIEPKSDNGTLTVGDVDVGPSMRPTLTVEYFVFDNVGIELLAAVPFTHNVDVDGLGRVAEVTHLPPTLSLQYHFTNASAFTPLLGVGVNYTTFFDEKGKGALDGAKVELGDSFGIALHAGVDYAISDNGAIRADVRWMDIDSQVKVNGDKLGEAEIDPFVFGVSYIHKF